MINIRDHFRSVRVHWKLYYNNKKNKSSPGRKFIFYKFFMSIRFFLILIIKKRIYFCTSEVLFVANKGYQARMTGSMLAILNKNKIATNILIASKDSLCILSHKELFFGFYMWLLCIYRYAFRRNYFLISGLEHILNTIAAFKIAKRSIRTKIIISINPACQFSRSVSLAFARVHGSKAYCYHFGFPSISSKDYSRDKCYIYLTYSSKHVEILTKFHGVREAFAIGNLFDGEYETENINIKSKNITFISFPTSNGINGLTDAQISPDNYYETLDWLRLYFYRKMPEYKFRIKPHPMDNNRSYLNRNRFEIINDPIEDVIFSSEILIGINSTVIFQSLRAIKPFILLNWYVGDLFGLRSEGYPLISNSISDFDLIVRKSLNNNADIFKDIYKTNIEFDGQKSREIFLKMIKKSLL
jgi:hypothetical protein